MAPSRGKGQNRASKDARTPASSSRRTPRSTIKANDAVPDVYQDLLAEAAVDESADLASDRPLKKRRVVASVSNRERSHNPNAIGNEAAGPSQRHNVQTIEASSDSGEEDSEFDFEDVDLDQPSGSNLNTDLHDEIADVSISVDAASTQKRAVKSRRKPVTASEKAFRLMVHKAHILCLLGHCLYINSWCNNAAVEKHLRPLLSAKTKSYLNPKTNDSQFQRDRSFMDGLQQASEAFRLQFTVSTSGTRRQTWRLDNDATDDIQADDAEPMDRADFISAASMREGSQDTANQLFCALLRSVGVEARLVCSLQPLPFTSVPAKSSTPQKPVKHTVFAVAPGKSSPATDSNAEDKAIQNSTTIGKVPSARRRLGQPSFTAEPAASPTPTRKKKSIRKLSYPIFWVEAFNAAQQKWIAIDPIVTETINKPTKIEPPRSYHDLNMLSYVIAFEDDGVARDVTRRYTRTYNAKVIRQRVESTENGGAWFKKALRVFRRRGGALDRDQVEDAELAQKEAREGLPNNVQDFKHHPYYALERHLKRNEVITSKREVGKVNAGTAKKPRMESVYRRQDVSVCRSADKWYRFGRIVQEGEQPIKRVPSRRAVRGKSPMDEDGSDVDAELTALYAPYQTELYVPPSIGRDGQIPKNGYGNLDIYVPSMVPAGGRHIEHKLARDAAKILRVDYADAVTGFEFKGRQGTAVMNGVVVAERYADAVDALVEGLIQDQLEDESKGRSSVALRLWKRFLTGLRIQDRVSAYGDGAGADNVLQEINEHEDEADDIGEGGGFLPDNGSGADIALPTAGRFSLEQLSATAKTPKRSKRKPIEEDSEEGANFTPEDSEMEYEATRATKRGHKIIQDESEDEYMPDADLQTNDDNIHEPGDDDHEALFGNGDEGGGFIPEGEGTDNGAAGFLPEDTEIDGQDQEIGGDFLLDGIPDHPPLGNETATSQDGDVATMDAITPIDADDNIEKQEITASLTDQHTAVKDPNQDDKLLNRFAGEPDFANANHPVEVSDLPISNSVTGVQKSSVTPQAVQSSENRKEHGNSMLLEADNAADYSDHGSMLSHDPEDEDAEPDWLESD